MGGPRHRSALAVVVASVCVTLLAAVGTRPVVAAPASFSPPGITQSQSSHRVIVGRAQTTRPPLGLATRSNASAAAVPSGTWVPAGPGPIAGTVQDPSQSGGAYGDVSGRVTALIADPTHSATVFAGAADGGVWKSTNGGTSWTPLTDSQPTLAIGSLAIDPTGQIIYAGTGEANGSQDSQYGDGVLKSIDGGSTWVLEGSSTLAGLHIGSIAVDRQASHAQRVLAATDAGLYVSTDGGSTWTRNTAIDTVINHLTAFDHSIFEVHQDPSVATRFFATVGDFCQNEQGQVLVSADSGSTWSNSDSLSVGTDCAMRVSLGAGPSNTEYAAWTDINGDLRYIRKSVNGGASWTTLPSTGSPSYFDTGGNPQGWYDDVVAVDPANANRAVFGGVTVINTTNGGASYIDVGHVYDAAAGLHPDFHAIAFTGANTLYVGNDGGVWYSTTLGGTSGPNWSDVNANLQITQFYGGSALNVSTLIGGAQDNGDPGRLPTTPPSPHWQQYGTGDGTGTAIVPGSNGNNIYMSIPQAGILRQTSALSGGIEANPMIAAPCNFGPNPPQGIACADPAAFVAPFVMDSANGNTLFAATNHVYRSTTGGLPAGNSGWRQISPDLTSGTSNFSGNADVINAMSMIPGTNTIVTGAALSGTVFETTNSATWVNISGNLPQPSSSTFGFLGSTGWITSVAINPTNSSEVWVTIGDSIGGTGTVWHTTTAGTTNAWADLSSGGTAPITGPVNSIVEDPTTPTTLYVGTATGVYTCTGCGTSSPAPVWSTAGAGMPNVSVDDVIISADNTTLVAWTHGRSAWELPLSGTGTPIANLQPTSLSFQSASAQTVTLSNWGDASLFPTVSLTGPNAANFSTPADTCSGQSVAPSSSCTVTVAFLPAGSGTLRASLQFADNAPGSPQTVSLSGTTSRSLYTLDGYGGVHAAGSAPGLPISGYWAGWNISRGMAFFADGTGGFVLDAYGGVNHVGSAPNVAGSGYWPGWDIARAIAVAPWATPADPAGYVLDGYGGVHPFGGAPPISNESYWPGFDIARGLVLLPSSTPASVAGYTLDGYGGVHPFGTAPSITGEAYWPGWDIARAIVMVPWATSGNPAGYVLDGYGGINPFGGAPPVSNESYWPGFNIARGVVILRGSTSSSVAGYSLDGYGGIHQFGVATPISGESYWPGWDIAHAIAQG